MNPTAAIALLLVLSVADGCSYVRTELEDGTHVAGRTLELGGVPGAVFKALNAGTPSDPMPYQLAVHPRGEVHRLSICGAMQPFKHVRGFVGVDSTIGLLDRAGLQITSDGMNEDGLTIAAQILRQSQYQTRSDDASVLAVCVLDLIPYVLGQYATVAEMVAGLANLRVVAELPLGIAYPDGANMQWSVDDAQGASVVLNWLGGELHVIDNTVGVMTNDPAFEWHLRNLNNFAGISNVDPDPSALAVETDLLGDIPSVVGHGYNLFGIPGDSSPPSRFVRLFYLKAIAERNSGKAASLDDGITLIMGLLNSVWITKGTVAQKSHGEAFSWEFTQYTTIKAPERREFFFRTYENPEIKKIALDRVDFGSNASKVRVPLYDGSNGHVDITDVFASLRVSLSP